MMNKNTPRRLGIIGIVILAFISGFLLITMPLDQPHNYEVHGADGKIYHTTNIAHGTGRIWFTDESGHRIELGGGYSVIQK